MSGSHKNVRINEQFDLWNYICRSELFARYRIIDRSSRGADRLRVTSVVADQPRDILTRGAMTHMHMSVRALLLFTVLNICICILIYRYMEEEYTQREGESKCGRQ